MDFNTMSNDDLTAALAELREAASALFALTEPTIEQVNEAEALVAAIGSIEGEKATRAAAVKDAADRFAAARALCERYGATVVLKGAGTVVAAPGAVPAVICAGNPGMAVGGMGDVLTGVLAALLAQGMPPREAAIAGALLHAAAGDTAAREDGERGLLPSDLLPWLRRLANPLRR